MGFRNCLIRALTGESYVTNSELRERLHEVRAANHELNDEIGTVWHEIPNEFWVGDTYGRQSLVEAVAWVRDHYCSLAVDGDASRQEPNPWSDWPEPEAEPEVIKKKRKPRKSTKKSKKTIKRGG